MSQVVDSTPVQATPQTEDLVAAIQQVLRESPEPLTMAKIRAHLPGRFRTMNLEEALERQVTAKVLHQYPKYRSPHHRFWDRPMPVHVAALLHVTLENGSLAWSELRRKLPAYALELAETILQEQVSQGKLYRHPRIGGRGGDRFGVRPADPKDYLRPELATVFERLEPLGFSRSRLQEAALELLHEEEWKQAPPPKEPKADKPAAAPATGTAGGTRPAASSEARPAPIPPAAQTAAAPRHPDHPS